MTTATREAPSDFSKKASTLVFRWWRGQDLNLRPSGYEPSSGHIGQGRLVSFRAIYQAFRYFVMAFGACG